MNLPMIARTTMTKHAASTLTGSAPASGLARPMTSVRSPRNAIVVGIEARGRDRLRDPQVGRVALDAFRSVARDPAPA